MKLYTLILLCVILSGITSAQTDYSVKLIDSTRGITIPNTVSLSNYTIEMWVKFDRQYLSDPINSSFGAYSVLMSRGGVINRSILIKNNRFLHYTFDGSERFVNGTTQIQPNVWYHIAIVAGSNQIMRLFVNGVQEGTGIQVGTLEQNGSYYIVGAGSPVSTDLGPTGMTVDELRISNVIRYTNNFTPPISQYQTDANTVALFSFNEGSGSSLQNQVTGAGVVSGTINANSYSWQSGKFSTQKSIQVISPNGGNTYQAGTVIPVQWSSANIANVKIEYTSNNGTNWQTISASVSASTGTYQWTLPTNLSDQYKVRITDVSDAQVSDASDTRFTVTLSGVPNDMVAYYPFIGNALDLSGNNFNGTVINAQLTTDRFGLANKAYEFNGSNQSISVAHNTLLNPSSNGITFSLWINIYDGSPVGSIIQKGGDWDNDNYLIRYHNIINYPEHGLSFSTIRNNIVYYNKILPPPSHNTWHHVVGSYDGKRLRTYLNGELIGVSDSVTTNTAYSNTSNLLFGYNQYQFKGKIDDIRIYSRGLDQSEVSAIYNYESFSGTLSLVSPNGGEQLTVGSMHTIQWTATDISTVDLEYSINNGSTWQGIGTGVSAASGSYAWLVPNTASTLCKIRISKSGTPLKFDISDSTFTIQPSPLPITWQSEITLADNGASSGRVVIGLSPLATNGIDTALGEIALPPTPPGGIFDARFELPVSPIENSAKDYRHEDSSKVTWLLRFQPGSGGYPVRLTWQPSSLPAGTFTLQDVITGTVVNVNMKQTNTLTVTNAGINILAIKYELAPPVAPVQVSPLANATEVELNATLSWRKGEGRILGYWLEATLDTASASQIIDSTLTDTTKSLNGLSFSKAYHWRVKAKNTAGWGSFSPWRKFTTVMVSWMHQIAVTDSAGNTRNIVMGTAPGAGNGIDGKYGEVALPPVPPGGIFDARFELPVQSIEQSVIDIRNDSLRTAEWLIRFQPGALGYPMRFGWRKSELPEGMFRLRDAITGDIINVNMKQDSTFTLTNNGITVLKIEYLKDICVPITLASGWNLASVPVNATDMRVATIFAGSSSQVFGFNNGYVTTDTARNGKGYWVRYTNGTTRNICGMPMGKSIAVKQGWNMIGGNEKSVAVSGITSTPANIVTTHYFGFNNGYITTTQLEPGKGYWVRVNADGVLTLPEGTPVTPAKSEPQKEQNTTITITEATGATSTLIAGKDGEQYEMPPLPPTGIFDARYVTNRYAATIEREESIILSSATYPIRVKVTGGSLTIGYGDKTENLTDGGESIITNPSVQRITVSGFTSGTNSIPTEYALHQNYPNPFNPETTIRFDLPEKSEVTLKVFNALGESVATLINGSYSAGSHTVNFDASALTSGVYFYRIVAGEYVKTLKMAVIK